jgi:hypothetical protein
LPIRSLRGWRFSRKSQIVGAEFASLNYKREQPARFSYRLDTERWPGTTDLPLRGAWNRSQVRDEPVSPTPAATQFRAGPKWWKRGGRLATIRFTFC